MKVYIKDEQDLIVSVRLTAVMGGEILDKLLNLNDPSKNKWETFSSISIYDIDLTTLSPTYFNDCVQSNTLLDHQKYLVPFGKNKISNNEKKELTKDTILQILKINNLMNHLTLMLL